MFSIASSIVMILDLESSDQAAVIISLQAPLTLRPRVSFG